ncbi:superoxide dismutase [Rhodanobacter sp. UC4436_H3]
MSDSTSPAFAGQHVLQPLPFDPRSLTGLSERLIVSHHENNYGGAVRNLNNLEKQLVQVSRDTPAFVVGGLRQHELMYRNSMTLHEAYFGNLGGDGRATGGIAAAISATYGSMDAWETHFRLTGASLGGGSGWAILAFELMTGELRTVWSGHHTQVLATALPLLVMDMYEHSYQMDYGAAALKYIEAFLTNVQWDEVDRRFAQAQALHRTLVGVVHS